MANQTLPKSEAKLPRHSNGLCQNEYINSLILSYIRAYWDITINAYAYKYLLLLTLVRLCLGLM